MDCKPSPWYSSMLPGSRSNMNMIKTQCSLLLWNSRSEHQKSLFKCCPGRQYSNSEIRVSFNGGWMGLPFFCSFNVQLNNIWSLIFGPVYTCFKNNNITIIQSRLLLCALWFTCTKDSKLFSKFTLGGLCENIWIISSFNFFHNVSVNVDRYKSTELSQRMECCQRKSAHFSLPQEDFGCRGHHLGAHVPHYQLKPVSHIRGRTNIFD